MTVIDVHTHMLSQDWVEALDRYGAPRYSVEEVSGGQRAVHLDGAPFMTLMPGMFDFDRRIEKMDEAGVDLAVISLTCPNVFWGEAEQSLNAARDMNDRFAEAQSTYPDRIRWFASLPWQHADVAVQELERACDAGAVGVMVLGNIDGAHLTDEAFTPVWDAIDARELPVLIHPTAPLGLAEMDMRRFNLVASVGFMFDTSLAVARMIFDGFFERYRKCKIIAGHAGGTLPYIAGRLDICFENMPACREKIDVKPSEYLKHIYYDTVTFRPESLAACVSVAGASQVLYGSDYPHNIGDMKGCLARVNDLPGDQRDAVASQNAKRIFNL